ncbi:unnamed protein product [Litomosoides sigmodontis]|uniref:Uncharacterized protein n=1 Tax=Litomosoides sigmodontis TaxID=42156 RepID=A0A3P6VE04_LITSI|nr:unnamed protein product [Litomosoides sigmodontis]
MGMSSVFDGMGAGELRMGFQLFISIHEPWKGGAPLLFVGFSTDVLSDTLPESLALKNSASSSCFVSTIVILGEKKRVLN